MYPYQPYPQPFQPQYQGYQGFQPQQLPPQQVLKANGKGSIDAIKMSPNSSAFVADTTAPIVWLCVSDSLGNVTSTPYDIAPHQDAPPVDVASFEQRLTTVEQYIAKKEGMNDAKPDARYAESKPNGELTKPAPTHQTGYEHGEISQQPVRYAESNAFSEPQLPASDKADSGQWR